MAVEADGFRAFFGSFPTAVSVVTATGKDGVPRGLTCTAITAVSASPPLMLVCVDERSTSLHALEEAGGFAVNVLAEGGSEVSDRFASRSDDKFSGLSWAPSTVACGAPVLTSSVLATAECSVTRQFTEGDHRIFVGLVLRTSVFPRRPLLHHRRVYSVWDRVGSS